MWGVGEATPSEYYELDTSKGGKASEGRIPSSTAPPSGILRAGHRARTGRPPRGVSQRTQPTSGILLAGHRQGRGGLRGEYTRCTPPPSEILRAGRKQGDGKPSEERIPAGTALPAGYC